MNLRDFMSSIPKERPTGITILAIFCFIYGASQAVAAIAGFAILFKGGVGGMIIYPVLAIIVLLGVALYLVEATLFVMTGIGLIRLRNWARLLLIALIGLQVLLAARALVHSASGTLAHLRGSGLIVCAITVWTVVYLFRPHVKRAFGHLNKVGVLQET